MTSHEPAALLAAFAIEVAENEGMPSKPSEKGVLQPGKSARGLTGTPTLEPSRPNATSHGPEVAETSTKFRKNVERHPLARLTILAGIMASLAFPVLATDCVNPMPERDRLHRDGGRFLCDHDVPMEVPEQLLSEHPAHRSPLGR